MKQSLCIGPIRLNNRLLLAPMVDVTDMAYRELCKNAGAAIAYTEMINIGAILHENEKTQRMLTTQLKERPVGIQITGRNIDEFKTIATHSVLKKYSLVDINCGCPSMRITGNESGSYLLNHPEKIGRMIRILKDAGHIVTAKIRLGFKKNNVLRVARMIEKNGADALTLHARLANQGGSVPANWKEIARIKKHIGIPLIGNGDVVNGKTASELLDIADGVMIARAAIGNPLIFRNVLHYLRTGKEKETTSKERIAQLQQYLTLVEKYDLVDMGRIKYIAGHTLKGFTGAADARMKAVQSPTIAVLRRTLSSVALKL